ncbi:MAG: hypothetical protein Q7U03_07565 [Syntrophales bacterium]|nr:hypothetical protein [Syntrophales bacterium]
MNQVSAPEEVKLAALADLLSEITGRDVLGHARHYDRNAEARIAGAAVIFGRIRELLRRFDSRLDDNRRVWPPIWLPVRREVRSELATLYPDNTDEEIEDLIAVYFPKEVVWLRLEFASDDAGRLELHLAPLSFHISSSSIQ